jgi:HTH-type transcriptional regulator / antitoxin HigA
MTKYKSKSYESVAEFSPEWIICPGESIDDILIERGWTQAEFSVRTGYTKKHISLLLNGKAPITEETAIKLERVLGSTARFWLNLEAQYREQLAKKEAAKQLEKDVEWLKELPLSDLIKFQWVNKAKTKAEQVFECLKFFGVASVESWREQYEVPVAAYRAAPIFTKIPGAVSSWLRYGEKEAEGLALSEFSSHSLEQSLDEIKSLTLESNPEKFIFNLKKICAKSGVAVVFAPAPKGCPVSGAAKWIDSNRALIMLSLRGKTDDKLWFTFFHEVAHLLKHGKKLIFLDILGEIMNEKEEAEADSFAQDHLIPKSSYLEFVKRGNFLLKNIKQFADDEGISPGIVVGRLQHDGYLAWNMFNHLKITYKWVH